MMQGIDKFLESIYQAYKIPYLYVDNKKNVLLYSSVHESHSIKENTAELELFNLCFENKNSYIIVLSLGVALAGIYIKQENSLIIFGKVFLGTRTTQDLLEEKLDTKYNIKKGKDVVLDYIYNLPLYSGKEFKRIVNFINLYFNSDTIKESNIVEKDDESLVEDNKMKYKDIENEIEHSFSLYIFNCISEGNDKKLLKFIKENYDNSSSTGVFHQRKVSTNVREMKNLFISACIMACNSAISGGMDHDGAYSLYEYYVQLVETIDNNETLENLFNEMFVDYARRVKKIKVLDNYSMHVNKAISYIEEHVYDQISTLDIAHKAKVSDNYLLRCFKKETGISLIDYINNIKINEAKSLLLYSDLSISDISTLLSFSSQSYFTYLFKKVCGITPTEYIHKDKS